MFSAITLAIYEFMAYLFFFAVTMVILVGAYVSERFDIWIVGALAVLILWAVFDKKCDNSKGGSNGRV